MDNSMMQLEALVNPDITVKVKRATLNLENFGEGKSRSVYELVNMQNQGITFPFEQVSIELYLDDLNLRTDSRTIFRNYYSDVVKQLNTLSPTDLNTLINRIEEYIPEIYPKQLYNTVYPGDERKHRSSKVIFNEKFDYKTKLINKLPDKTIDPEEYLSNYFSECKKTLLKLQTALKREWDLRLLNNSNHATNTQNTAYSGIVGPAEKKLGKPRNLLPQDGNWIDHDTNRTINVKKIREALYPNYLKSLEDCELFYDAINSNKSSVPVEIMCNVYCMTAFIHTLANRKDGRFKQKNKKFEFFHNTVKVNSHGKIRLIKDISSINDLSKIPPVENPTLKKFIALANSLL